MGLLRKIVAIVAIAMFSAANAQTWVNEVDVKTNALYDATLSLSFGAELQTAANWSVELTGSYNGWDVGGNKWRHWILQPELRYWTEYDEMDGHFFAVNVLFGQVNVGCFSSGLFGDALKNSRFQGWAMGAGIGYGYAWRLGRNHDWKIEAEATVGIAHFKLDRFSAHTGHIIQRNRTDTSIAPTKIAVNICYAFNTGL